MSASDGFCGPVVRAGPRVLARQPVFTQFTTEWSLDEATDLTAPAVAVANVRTGNLAAALAQVIATQGRRILLTGPDGPAVRAVSDAVHRDGGRAAMIVADGTGEEGAVRIGEFLGEQTGALEAVVWVGDAINPTPRPPFRKATATHLNRFWRENLTAPALLTREVVERFFRPNGNGTLIYVGPGHWYQPGGARTVEAEMVNDALDALRVGLAEEFGTRLNVHLVRPSSDPKSPFGPSKPRLTGLFEVVQEVVRLVCGPEERAADRQRVEEREPV
jgi:NAD(P)-dependent dehydrogenase (short-subunit alcohol dehydrogenase family)